MSVLMRLILDKGVSSPAQAPASNTLPQKPVTTGQQSAPAAKQTAPAGAPAAPSAGALMTKALAGFGAGAGAKKTAPLAAAIVAAAPALSSAPPTPAPAEPSSQGQQGQSKSEQSAPGSQKPNNLDNKGSCAATTSSLVYYYRVYPIKVSPQFYWDHPFCKSTGVCCWIS